jgi:hypothetical protein
MVRCCGPRPGVKIFHVICNEQFARPLAPDLPRAESDVDVGQGVQRADWRSDSVEWWVPPTSSRPRHEFWSHLQDFYKTRLDLYVNFSA